MLLCLISLIPFLFKDDSVLFLDIYSSRFPPVVSSLLLVLSQYVSCCSNKHDKWGFWCLVNELWSENLWCLTAEMMYPDESMYSHFHFLWHTVLLLNTLFFCYCEWYSLSMCACVCAFLHSRFPHRPRWVMTSVHLNPCAYLKCFKRLLSVLFVLTGRAPFSCAHTLTNSRAWLGTQTFFLRKPPTWMRITTCVNDFRFTDIQTFAQIHHAPPKFWGSLMKQKVQKMVFFW